MKESLNWKLNRLRRMGGREIVFRVIRQTKQIVEKERVLNGWEPEPPAPVTPRQSLLPPLHQYKAIWERRFGLDYTGIDRLASGVMDLFGHHKIQLKQPVEWHLDPVTGIRAPITYGKSIDYRNSALVGNIKVMWELGRHHHLVPLAVAYALTGNERYLKAITGQIESWIDQNPFATGIHWCSALEVALRLISWTLVHSLIASRIGTEGLFAVVRDSKAFGKSVYQQAWFIRHYLSRHSSAANHLFGELSGLWVASQVFDLGEDGAKWMEEAQEELEEQLQLQVFQDGVDKEQALYYHLWVLEYALFLQISGRRVGSPYSDKFCKRIAAMAEFIRDVTPTDGNHPQLGDADDGFVTRFSATWPVDPYKEILDTEKLISEKCITEKFTEKAFWYGIIGGYSDALIRSKPCDSVARSYPKIYSEGGYAILGNDDCHLVFDAGSLGYLSIAAHGHADALSFTLALDGNWWLVDPGTYVYHRFPEWRNYFRSTRAHNCVVVDGKDQSIMSGPFMWARHASAYLTGYGNSPLDGQWAKGCHDGYQNIGVTHCREIRLHSQSGRIDVVDELKGTSRHHVEIWFQCAPDVQVHQQVEGHVWELTRNDDSRVILLHLDAEMEWEALRGQEHPYIAGWYSSMLDSREPVYSLHGYMDCVLPKRITTSIIYG